MTARPAALTARPAPAELLTALAALGVLLAAVIGLPVLLYLIAGLPVPHHAPSPGQLTRALLTRDNTALFLTAADLTAWAGWVVFTGCTALETAAVLTGRLPRHLPALAGPQHLAARLVTAAAVLLPAASLTTLTPRPLPARPVAAAALTSPVGQLPSFGISPAADTAPWAAPGQAGGNGQQHNGAAPAPARSYVVRRGDTLWGIASRELGDPEEWKTIAALNYDRPQPAGTHLTDSHWIYPGWTLLLPHPHPGPGPAPTPAARAARPVLPHPAEPPPASTPALKSAGPSRLRADGPSEPRTPAGGTGGPPEASRAQPADPAPGVPLSDGGLVSAGFAAGVLAALSYTRRRRGRGRHPQPPGPPQFPAVDPLLTPTVRTLTRAAASTADDPDDTPNPRGPEPAGQHPPGPGRAGAAASRPATGIVELGVQHGEPVTLDLLTSGGLILTGPGARAVGRALLTGQLLALGADQLHLLLPPALAADLGLPAGVPGLHLGDSPELLIRAETELLSRYRLTTELAADLPGQPDASKGTGYPGGGRRGLDRLQAAFPGEPLPLILLTAVDLGAGAASRLAALLTAGPRVGITVLLLSPPDPPLALPLPTLHADAGGTVTASSSPTVPVGTRLYTMTAEQAGEITGLLLPPPAACTPAPAPASAPPPAPDGNERAAIRIEQPADSPPPAAVEPNPSVPGPGLLPADPPADAPEAEGTPAGDTAAGRPAGEQRRVGLRVFGPVQVAVDGEPMRTGLRNKTRELLALLAVHPAGMSTDGLTEALFPDADPARGPAHRRTLLSNLRAALDTPADPPVLVRQGDWLALNPSGVHVDLWAYTDHLQTAQTARTTPADRHRAGGAAAERDALEHAVCLHTGDFAAGAGYEWAEPVRQELRERTSDALLRLAQLHQQQADPAGVVDALARAVDIAPDEEELYRRLMAAHARAGDPLGVRATYRKLQARLDELDAEPDDTTEHLLGQLLRPHTRPPAPAPTAP